MNKIIFTISDIHGHYQETIKALQEAGWDEDNPNHLLVVCGDIFDRGDESLTIFQWLYRLTQDSKAIVTKGNHEPFLIQFLDGDNDNFNYKYNGLNNTLDDFVHSTSDFKMFLIMNQDKNSPTGLNDTIGNLWDKWCYNTRKLINEENPELLSWLKSLPYYYETENYIFTHASIDTLALDWHHPHCDNYGKFLDWDACVWDDGSFFGKSICNTDKTVVVGHYHTNKIRQKYHIGNSDDYGILTRNDGRIIMIDGCTPYTKKVNVLKLEDKLIENKNNENFKED
jgi:serine/threonine protein phosphatase 1